MIWGIDNAVTVLTSAISILCSANTLNPDLFCGQIGVRPLPEI